MDGVVTIGQEATSAAAFLIFFQTPRVYGTSYKKRLVGPIFKTD